MSQRIVETMTMNRLTPCLRKPSTSSTAMKLYIAIALGALSQVATGWVAIPLMPKSASYHDHPTRRVQASSSLPKSSLSLLHLSSSSSSTIEATNVTDATTTTEKGIIVDEECVVPEEQSEAEKMMQQVKDAGVAGVISYAAWELAFWAVSVPICILAYQQVTGCVFMLFATNTCAKVSNTVFVNPQGCFF